MIIHWKMKVMVNNFLSQKRLLLIYYTYCTSILFTWAKRQVTDSSQSYLQSETGITLRYLKISLSSLGLNKIYNFIWGTVIFFNCFGLPGVGTDSPVIRQVRHWVCGLADCTTVTLCGLSREISDHIMHWWVSCRK